MNNTQSWLKFGAISMIAFGVISLMGLSPKLATTPTFLIDMIYWPLDGAQTLEGETTRLLLAIFGGLMAGWGIMIWKLATDLYPENPDLTRSIILTSIGTWYLIDSSASIYVGAPLNAALNLFFLVIFFIPLWSKSTTVPIKQNQ